MFLMNKASFDFVIGEVVGSIGDGVMGIVKDGFGAIGDSGEEIFFLSVSSGIISKGAGINIDSFLMAGGGTIGVTIAMGSFIARGVGAVGI